MASERSRKGIDLSPGRMNRCSRANDVQRHLIGYSNQLQTANPVIKSYVEWKFRGSRRKFHVPAAESGQLTSKGNGIDVSKERQFTEAPLRRYRGDQLRQRWCFDLAWPHRHLDSDQQQAEGPGCMAGSVPCDIWVHWGSCSVCHKPRTGMASLSPCRACQDTGLMFRDWQSRRCHRHYHVIAGCYDRAVAVLGVDT